MGSQKHIEKKIRKITERKDQLRENQKLEQHPQPGALGPLEKDSIKS